MTIPIKTSILTYAIDEYGAQHPITLTKSKYGAMRVILNEQIYCPQDVRAAGMLTAFDIPCNDLGSMSYLLASESWKQAVRI